jgi:hypothetical protein
MRVINSPGVQITETDLSFNQQVGGGTNVYIAGFAAQGPTDEVNLVTTISEFEQIYGQPQTAAERYFYHSCKEVLNSPATLLTTRLPYGSGSGEVFSSEYSALLYPVTKSVSSYNIGAPKHINLNGTEYNNFVQGNIKWIGTGSTTTSTTTVTAYQNVSVTVPTSSTSIVVNFIKNTLTNLAVSATSTVNDENKTIANQLTGVIPSNIVVFSSSTPAFSIDPTPNTYQINSLDADNSSVSFSIGTSSVQTTVAGTPNYDPNLNEVNAGLIILNQRQTTINEAFEGYYVNISDNSEFGPDSNFTAASQIFALTGTNKFAQVTQDRLSFALSADFTKQGSNSISETIEGIPQFNFSNPYYNDSVVITVFKVRNSIYEPQVLAASLAESWIGSFNKNRKTAADLGGIERTFYIQDIINDRSANLKLYVNPSVAEDNWIVPNSTTPASAVRIKQEGKALFTGSVYNPVFNRTQNKEIGNVVDKVQRALSLVESTETAAIDVVCDAGLSTIYSNASASTGYNDEKAANLSDLFVTDSQLIGKWRSMFNVFNNFVENTRRDCIFLSDPLRQIFVNGENAKTLAFRGNTFSINIFKPLKNLYAGINSNYSVAYGNWVKAYDPYADKQFWMPFSAYAAAVIARTDAATQPWIAPAGLNRGVVNNAIDLAFNPNQKQRDFLYNIGVNPVVFFSGDGFVVFGQKTLQDKPSAFDRINVRRLFLVLEKAVMSVVKYYVFEPNTAFTRTRLVNDIIPVFELAKTTQGLYDYLIVCDERNNTPDLIDRNEMAVDIYVKPVRAAEFILVNFIATRTGQNFQELI